LFKFPHALTAYIKNESANDGLAEQNASQG